MMKQLLAIPIAEFNICFRKREGQWKKIVASHGEYFEGHIIDQN